MKRNRQFLTPIFVILFVFLTNYGFGQIRIYTEGSYVKAEVTEEQKTTIMESATKILNEYVRVASFLNEDGEFSDDSYSEFLSIFSGNAEVFNDIAKKNEGNMNYAIYADRVYQYMQGTGVKFELAEAYLDEITYDSSGFYTILVSFQKTLFNGINEKFEIVNYPNNGRSFDLKMKIEIPEYDLTQAVIMNVLGEAKKVKVESANLISVSGNYHLGNVTKTTSTLTTGFNDDMGVKYNSYGVDVVFRKSLNAKKSIYFLLGASAGFHNFSTDLNSYLGSSEGILNAELGALDDPNQPIPITVKSNRTILQGSEIGTGDNALIENLQVIDIQIPIGVSLRLYESYNWDFFLDVAAVPTYGITSSGKYQGSLSTLDIPADRDKFPVEFEQYVIENNLQQYFSKINFDEELVETASNFSAAVQVSPLIHYKFNFKMSLEFGLNVSYGFLPYFKNETNHLSPDGGQSVLLNIADVTSSSAQNPSVLQNNFKDVGIFRYGARLGIVFKL